MEEAWRPALKNKIAHLIDHISFEKAQVSRSGDKMCVFLTGDRLFTDEEFSSVKKAFASMFPGIRMEVRMSYPSLAGSVRGDLNKYKPFLTDIICKDSPGMRPALTHAEWSFDQEALTLFLQDEVSAMLIRQKGIEKQLSGILKDVLCMTCPVKIAVSGDERERIAEINKKREEDEKRFAELAQAAAPAKKEKKEPPKVLYGRSIPDEPIEISELTEDAGRVTLKGEIMSFERRNLKNDTTILITFTMTDYTGSVYCKAFAHVKGNDEEKGLQQLENLTEALQPGAWVKVRGKYQMDSFMKEMVVMIDDVMREDVPKRVDKAEKKRVELHCHSQMSTMDGLASAGDLIKQAAKWGHPAIAITDHGVLQAFPEAFGAAKKNNIKLIPGCEGYLIDDAAQIVDMPDKRALASTPYVVLDVETTGLNTATDMIIEIGAVRIENGVEVGEFSQLINPERPVPEKVVELTGINDGMLRDKPTIKEVIKDFAAFCEGAVLVAHNASFDMAFFDRAFRDAGIPFEHPKMDTLTLVRNLYPDQKSFKLGNMCKFLGISLSKAHRAVHDARATGEMMLIALKKLMEEKGATTVEDMNSVFTGDAGGKSFHIILLAKNQTGMINLNRLVSEGHLHYFHRTPRIPRGLIQKYREGLIIGSACEAGELFRAMVEGKDDRVLERIAKFYDYLEIQPIGNNEFMIRNGVAKDEEALRDYNRRIVKLGAKLGIPVCATGDVHFKDPKDSIFRAIIMTSKGFEDADQQAPLYFRTTDDMLEEFSYLGPRKAMEVVVDNPNAIADMVEKVSIFIKHPEGKETFQPFWEDAENFIRGESYRRAKELYGDPLPDIVEKRLQKELSSICGYGFSTLYNIAVKLVKKSNADGYIVGSRGSVGSSFVAHMTGITEVNALPPHYACQNCHHVEFEVPPEYTCGLDLPPKNCPECGTLMMKDGFNIPFEVFLGFKGDKVPDIDLNFSGEYQPVAHNYVKELFGVENVYRAGTIGTVAEKTAYGYVLKYLELHGKTASNAEKERLAAGCVGVKRTSGQHPAGMVVVPKGYEIYQFTAIQHPADDQTTDTVTTHYDFNSMHDVLVKLDILGHDDPTMLRKLQDLTGIAPQDVPLDDPEVYKAIMSLFSKPDALGVTADEIGCPTGTLGIPEMGTPFVRGMLMDTKPSTMEELIRISGLSHGTDVWLGNIQDIVKSGTATLKSAPCTRDDIMNQLIEWGVAEKTSFDIMEYTRKGKAAKAGGVFAPGQEEAMIEAKVPDWFIGACKKIAYMFPKAHAVAYVTMALRIAYFKVFYPHEYYACYLKRNLEKFDGAKMVSSLAHVKAWLAELQALPKQEQDKEGDTISILETMVELYARGVKILPVDVYESAAEDFVLNEKKELRAPLCSLPGLGLSAAQNLIRIREEGPFTSQEDMVRRKVSKSVVEMLKNCGALGDMPASSQVSLFDFGGMD